MTEQRELPPDKNIADSSNGSHRETCEGGRIAGRLTMPDPNMGARLPKRSWVRDLVS